MRVLSRILYLAAGLAAAAREIATLDYMIEKMPGDHHFDEDYPGIARRILEQLPPPPTTASPPPPRN